MPQSVSKVKSTRARCDDASCAAWLIPAVHNGQVHTVECEGVRASKGDRDSSERLNEPFGSVRHRGSRRTNTGYRGGGWAVNDGKPSAVAPRCRVCRVNAFTGTHGHTRSTRTNRSQPSQPINASTPHDRATTESVALPWPTQQPQPPGANQSQPLLAADSEEAAPFEPDPAARPAPAERLHAPAQRRSAK